jgi:hypothetical protein
MRFGGAAAFFCRTGGLMIAWEEGHWHGYEIVTDADPDRKQQSIPRDGFRRDYGALATQTCQLRGGAGRELGLGAFN